MGGSLAFFGHFFLGIGPGTVFFALAIAPKSFLTLLSFTSCFFWLLVLLVTSAVFRGFQPIPLTVGSFAGLLAGAVVIQELCRLAVAYAHRATCKVLTAHARTSGHRFSALDRIYLCLAWGFGHGTAHVVFFVLSFLPLTTSDATWYLDVCPSMSMFLVGALYANAFGMLLPSLMVIFLHGLAWRQWFKVGYAPVAHLAAAVLTLLNLKHNGCLVAMPLLLMFGLANVMFATYLAWEALGSTQVPEQETEGTELDAGLIQNAATVEGGGVSSTSASGSNSARRRTSRTTAAAEQQRIADE